MNGFYEELVRIFLGFFILLVLTRLIGKKQLGQLNIFTYITGMAMGNMAGSMIIHPHVKISTAIIGMTVWTILIIIVEYMRAKVRKDKKCIRWSANYCYKKRRNTT